MLETLQILPSSFWVVVALLIAGAVVAFRRMRDGTGIPLLAVLGTTSAWYVGDAFYNDYADNHAKLFDTDTLSGAWWQVALCLGVLLLITPVVHRGLNRRYLSCQSGVVNLFRLGINQTAIQGQLQTLFKVCVVVWAILFLVAVIELKFEVIHYIFPFIGYKVSPWSHGQIGTGLDFLSIPAVYLNLLVAAVFGVVAALVVDPRVRRLALGLCIMTWPYFIFDRTRNTMLAMVVPGVLCWGLLRIRGTIWKKGMILILCYCAINFWMKFVIANRSTMSITTAIQEKGFSLGRKDVHNEGLNMFEELCWISTFIDNGTYHVNWGRRYFAEIVNPIPRAFWHGKPLIGIDYAIARGHGQENKINGVVNTTIATGFIGQGVVNFGRVLGPMAAAILMSMWVAILARLDLNIQALGRLPLYSLGLILTFNMGRDITLLVLYPFVFGALVIWVLDRWGPPNLRVATVPVVVGPAEPSIANVSLSRNRPSLFVPRVKNRGFLQKAPPI